MSNNDIDVSHTIVPKSDQLNADDMITGAILFTIQGIKLTQDPAQPIIVGIDGGKQPYKPCKSMRRVLIKLWGKNANDWVGRSFVLYCDPNVKFGKEKVGGIRISHMSNIQGTQKMMLTTSRMRRSEFTVIELKPNN